MIEELGLIFLINDQPDYLIDHTAERHQYNKKDLDATEDDFIAATSVR